MGVYKLSMYLTSDAVSFLIDNFLAVSIYSYWRINTKVREEVRKLNKELAALHPE